MSPRLLLAIVGVLLLFLLIRSAVPDAEPTSPVVEPTAVVSATQILAELPDFLLSTPRPMPTPDPEAAWTERLRLSDSEVVRSEPFELHGGLVRLSYALEGNVTLLAITVLPDAPTSVTGLPDVMASPGRETERLLVRPPGTYRLGIQPVTPFGGGAWTVIVEEEEPPAAP